MELLRKAAELLVSHGLQAQIQEIRIRDGTDMGCG